MHLQIGSVAWRISVKNRFIVQYVLFADLVQLTVNVVGSSAKKHDAPSQTFVS